MSILSINGLSKRYGNVRALNDLNLEVKPSQIFGILGPNGSGKTTTLAIILGVIKQDAGNFTWFNQLPNELTNNSIGALLETPNFYPYLTLYQNLNVVSTIKRIEKNVEIEIERVLRIVNLWERKNSIFSTLSLGMKQRMSIASLLLGDPQILILDEPANGLDPQGIAEIREIIKTEAAKGKTILLASHILDEVEKVCTHVAILKSGNLIACSTVNDIVNQGDTLFVECDQNQNLYDLLIRSGMTKTIEFEHKKLILKLHHQYKAKDVNEFAFKNNIILSQLETHKKTLESQFLEMMK